MGNTSTEVETKYLHLVTDGTFVTFLILAFALFLCHLHLII